MALLIFAGLYETGREFEKHLEGWNSCWEMEDGSDQRRVGLLSLRKEHRFVVMSICIVGQG